MTGACAVCWQSAGACSNALACVFPPCLTHPCWRGRSAARGSLCAGSKLSAGVAVCMLARLLCLLTACVAPPRRAFGDMEFKGQAGLKLLLQKGIEFELWDQAFADSRCAGMARLGTAFRGQEVQPCGVRPTHGCALAHEQQVWRLPLPPSPCVPLAGWLVTLQALHWCPRDRRPGCV